MDSTIMCFSAAANFVGNGVLGGLGIATPCWSGNQGLTLLQENCKIISLLVEFLSHRSSLL
jgi:hypothetical protein